MTLPPCYPARVRLADAKVRHSRRLPIGPKELALHVADFIDGRQGIDVTILDVTGPLVIADYFVVATVRNDRHGNALARELIHTLKADGRQRRNAAGLDVETGWVLLDFDDVVVHLFIEDSRAFYDLENLWSDAPRVPFEPKEPRPSAGPDVGPESGSQAMFPQSLRAQTRLPDPTGTE